MSNYTKTTDFAAKDSLPTGDSGKIVRGAEFETEFDAISTAIATKADTAGPTFTGTATFATTNATTVQIGGVAITSTAAELNLLDGVTATTAEINLLDGVTATTAELNILDGVTSTATELNLLDGITGILDEDNMASDSATALATQQSIKAYVDSTVAATNEVVEDTTPQLGGDLDTNGNDILFADNDKAIFGAGSDLQIYHDGSNSFIDEVGTGTLRIRGHNQVRLTDTSDNIAAIFKGDAESTLYHNNSAKLATTSTGIDVTGNVVSDGLTVDGNAEISSASPQLAFMESDTTDLNTRLRSNAGKFQIHTANDAESSFTLRFEVDNSTGNVSIDSGNLDVTGSISADGLDVNNIKIESDLTATPTNDGANYIFRAASGHADYNGGDLIIQARSSASRDIYMLTGTTTPVNRFKVDGGGDISFYEDTGTTAKFFWDASTERLGIGTSSPAAPLHLKGLGGCELHMESGDGNSTSVIKHNQSTDALEFYPDGSLAMTLQAGNQAIFESNVGIGTSSPSTALHVVDTTGDVLTLESDSAAASPNIIFKNNDGENARINSVDGGELYFGTGSSGTEALRIDSSQNVLIGNTNTDPATNNVNGVAITAGGEVIASLNGVAAQFNRRTTDGDVAVFKKGGSTKGSIGILSSRLYIGSGDTGIKFSGADDLISPIDASDGTGRDAAIDLGSSSTRFKDLYLSGGAYLGGTTSANLLDDYEEGTFTVTLRDATSGGNTSSSTVLGTYTKVGRLVTCSFNTALGNIDTTGMTGTNVLFMDLPFATNSSCEDVGTLVYDNLDTGSINASITNVVPDGVNGAVAVCQFRAYGNNTSDVTLQVHDITSGTTDFVRFTYTYQTA